MSAKSVEARTSPIAASAITSSQVSAPVTQGLVLTQRMPSPSTTKVSHRDAMIASAAGPRTAPPSTG
jgi:hypothetical protein